MGSAASKAPKRTFPKTGTLQRTEKPTSQTADHIHPSSGPQPDTQQQAGENGGTESTSALCNNSAKVPHCCADQHAHDEIQEQDFLRQLKQEGVKHAELGSFLDKLGGAIAGKHVSTLDIKVLPSWLSSNHRAMLPNIQYSPLAPLLGTVVAATQQLEAQYCSNASRVTSRAPCPAAW